MDFKNLAEVTQLTEVPEGASVLAATAEGEVVRVPGDGLGGGGGVIFSIDAEGNGTCNTPFDDVLKAYNDNSLVASVFMDTIASSQMVSSLLVVGLVATGGGSTPLAPGSAENATAISINALSLMGSQAVIGYASDGSVSVQM